MPNSVSNDVISDMAKSIDEVIDKTQKTAVVKTSSDDFNAVDHLAQVSQSTASGDPADAHVDGSTGHYTDTSNSFFIRSDLES